MKALNRKEVLVNAKANGTLDSFKPLTRDEAFTKKALELGGGASSWNNLTDKPFGEEIDNEVIYDATNVEFFYSNDYGYATSGYLTGHLRGITVGSVYTVVWDGVTYSNLVAHDSDGYPAIGAVYTETDEEMPFSICTGEFDGVGFMGIYTYDDAMTHSISISEAVKVVRKLDKKYLSDLQINLTRKSTDGKYTANTTIEEITEAIENGDNVRLHVTTADEIITAYPISARYSSPTFVSMRPNASDLVITTYVYDWSDEIWVANTYTLKKE